MPNLSYNRCSACHKGAPIVTTEEIAVLKPQLDPAWRIIEVNGVPRLERVFSMKNFVQALEFAHTIGDIAESEGHHPALLVEWGQLTVSWWTHAIANLHRNDFIMAAKTDRAFNQLQDTTREATGADH